MLVVVRVQYGEGAAHRELTPAVLAGGETMTALSNGDSWWFATCFAIVTALLVAVRDRLKRIEEKLDQVIGRKGQS
jgi:hypothetical protein